MDAYLLGLVLRAEGADSDAGSPHFRLANGLEFFFQAFAVIGAGILFKSATGLGSIFNGLVQLLKLVSV